MQTAVSPTTQPSRKTGAFTRARSEKSTRTTAMIGSGLMATPTAKTMTSLMP